MVLVWGPHFKNTTLVKIEGLNDLLEVKYLSVDGELNYFYPLSGLPGWACAEGQYFLQIFLVSDYHRAQTFPLLILGLVLETCLYQTCQNIGLPGRKGEHLFKVLISS